MSHFIVVLAIENDTLENVIEQMDGEFGPIHRMLAPYQENNMGDAPQEYLEFHDIEDECRNKWETGVEEGVLLSNGDWKFRYAEEFHVGEMFDRTWVYPDDSTFVSKPYTELYPTFEDYMNKQVGHRNELTGRYGFWENPNAEWDWYTVGGRWKGYFDLKSDGVGIVGKSGAFANPIREGYTADIALKSDIDFDGNYEKRYKEGYDMSTYIISELCSDMQVDELYYVPFSEFRAKHDIETARQEYHNQPVFLQIKERNSKISKDEPKKEDEHWTYVLLSGGDKTDLLTNPQKFAEDYALSCVIPFALVDKNGWHSNGQMGWFGSVYNETEDKATYKRTLWQHIMSYSDDTVLVAVDCHI